MNWLMVTDLTVHTDYFGSEFFFKSAKISMWSGTGLKSKIKKLFTSKQSDNMHLYIIYYII